MCGPNIIRHCVITVAVVIRVFYDSMKTRMIKYSGKPVDTKH